MSGAYPVQDPAAAGPHADWYAANVAADAITVQRCAQCGRTRLPARHMCADCHSMEWGFEATDGTATLVSWTTSHRALHPAFHEVVPYTIGVVELGDGIRITAVVRDVDHATLEVGSALRTGVDAFGVPFAALG